MKCLVTGANGFLGSWLCRRLIAEGHEVTALVRKNSDLSELDGVSVKFEYGDVTDLESLNQSFKNKDVIFHLAGVIAYKKQDRALMEKVNVHGTQNVIQAVSNQGVNQLLHLSSVVAIGSSFKPVSLNEESPYTISDLNLGYFETKKQAEDLVISAAQRGVIQAVCVNPATIYGPGDAKKGSRKTQLKVAQGKFPFYTSGGVNVVPVEKVVDGIIKAVQKGKNGHRYILASENMTIKKLFETIADCAGVPAPKILMPNFILHGLGILGDSLQLGISRENAYTATMYHWFDSQKAQQELGFDTGSSYKAIENSVRWMKDQGYLSK